MLQFWLMLGFKIFDPLPVFQLLVPKTCCGSGPAVPAMPDLVSELKVKLGTPHPLQEHGAGQCGHLVPVAHPSAPHVHS